MIRSILAAVFSLLLVTVPPTGPVAAAETIEPLLKTINFRDTPDEEEVVFELNGYHPPRVFGIEGDNPRVVCDFLDADLDDSIGQIIELDGDFIRRLRVGKHTEPDAKVRVVLDLVPELDYDIEQLFVKGQDRFVIKVRLLEPPAVKTDAE